jgi:hypothetical protein
VPAPQTFTSRRSSRLVVVAVVLCLLAGCTSGVPGSTDLRDASLASADPAAVADSNVADPAEYATNEDSGEVEPGFVQVDANTATATELATAFETNGIDDGAVRADDVIGHRPYPVGDPNGDAFDGLRASLAEAGLDDFAVEAVIASLTV